MTLTGERCWICISPTGTNSSCLSTSLRRSPIFTFRPISPVRSSTANHIWRSTGFVPEVASRAHTQDAKAQYRTWRPVRWLG